MADTKLAIFSCLLYKNTTFSYIFYYYIQKNVCKKYSKHTCYMILYEYINIFIRGGVKYG